MEYIKAVDVSRLTALMTAKGVTLPGIEAFMEDVDEQLRILALRYKHSRPTFKTYASYQELSTVKRVLMRKPALVEEVGWLISADKEGMRGWKKEIFSNTKLRELTEEERLVVSDVFRIMDDHSADTTPMSEIKASFPKTLRRQRGLYQYLVVTYKDDKLVLEPSRTKDRKTVVETRLFARSLRIFDEALTVTVDALDGRLLVYTDSIFLLMAKP